MQVLPEPFNSAHAIIAGDERSGKDSDDAFDMSTMKGKLAKRAAAGGKRGKKAVEEKTKKKDDPKKPKQKVVVLSLHHARMSNQLLISCVFRLRVHVIFASVSSYHIIECYVHILWLHPANASPNVNKSAFV
jgi:hypothetical protein